MSSLEGISPLPGRKIGLIAGNGRFPLFVLEEALKDELEVVVAAIREETSPEVGRFEQLYGSARVRVYWMGLGQLGKLIRTFKREGVQQAVMAGQVKHVQIFAPGSSTTRRLLTAMPDTRMLRLLMSLPQKNTSALIGGIARVLRDEGIALLDSTVFLKPLLPTAGILTQRVPDHQELCDMDFGWPIGRELARLDVGQTVVVKNQAIVAVEAMEGTDETIRRAARLTSGQPITVVKVARPDQDMKFDVPVVGLDTLDVLEECNVTALAIEAGRTLILDRIDFLRRGDAAGITIVAREA